MGRKVRQPVIKPASKTLTLPSSMELPYMAETVDDAAKFNEDFMIWWERTRVALMYAWEDQLVGGLKEEIKETTSTITQSVQELAEEQSSSSTPGASGGTPSKSGNTWDGGVHSQSSWTSRADGGFAGVAIFSMDGGNPSSNYSSAVQPELKEVDHSRIHDLITGTHSGGTP